MILVPVLINFEGLGASLNTRERSRADVYFPLFPFKDNFIKSLCFHSGLNMGHLNGKVIISPRLLMERRESGKGGMRVRGRGWQLRASLCACTHRHTVVLQQRLHISPHTGTRCVPRERQALSIPPQYRCFSPRKRGSTLS